MVKSETEKEIHKKARVNKMKDINQTQGAPPRLKEMAFSDKTIPLLFKDRFEKRPEKIAFRHKEMGIYKEVTWRRYWNEVELCALGLIDLGMEKNDRIGIHIYI